VPGHTIDEVRHWWSNQAIPKETIDRIFTAEDFNTGRMTKHLEDQESAFLSLGVCTMAVLHDVITINTLAEYYTAVTGINMSPEELRKAGERGWNLAKLVNVREGFTREDDRLPRLWEIQIEHPIKTKTRGDITLIEYFGKSVTKDSLQKMYDDYYDEHGWDIQTGVPTKRKLIELGLKDFAEIVESV